MSLHKLRFGLLAGAVLAAAAAAHEHAAKSGNTPDDVRAAFERIKKLAGDWQLADGKGPVAAGKVASRYRVTSGGSAVIETVFPDSDHEMVTVYHLDGGQILLTHYCHLGNQPQMRAKAGAASDELVFDFAGGNNINPGKDTYMHDCRIRFVDDDHLHSQWRLYVDGKPGDTHVLEFVRKK